MAKNTGRGSSASRDPSRRAEADRLRSGYPTDPEPPPTRPQPKETPAPARLPLDERVFAALVDALGQDEDDAQHALDAVLPALREAWDDGYYSGAADERADPGGKSKSLNPYSSPPGAGSDQ